MPKENSKNRTHILKLKNKKRNKKCRIGNTIQRKRVKVLENKKLVNPYKTCIEEEEKVEKEEEQAAQKDTIDFHERLKNLGSHLKIAIPMTNQVVCKKKELNQELVPKNNECNLTLPCNNEKSNYLFFSPDNKSESLENENQSFSGFVFNPHYYPLFSANKLSPKIVYFS